jgi:lipopolysaccharide export system permease protein
VRIIDKYLLKEFALPLVYCFDAFVMLFIVLDLLDNLSNFLMYHAKFSAVLHYYLIILPEAVVMILPMSLLLAVMFCLSNLGKNNELIALRASGLSILRLALPLLAVGLAASVAVFLIDEAFVPRGKEKAEAFMADLRGRSSKYVLENFFFANTTERRDWFARRFDTRTRQLETVEIHQRSAANKPQLDIFADNAVWTNGQWRFRQADIYDYSRGPETAPWRAIETNFPAFTEQPRRLILEARRASQMTTSELRRQIATLEHARRRGHVAEYQVEYYRRYAFPLTCFIVIWLGVPLGMRTSRRAGAMMGVATALLLVVAFYFLTNISLALGKGEHLPPALAAWLTNAIFATIGAVLLARAN